MDEMLWNVPECLPCAIFQRLSLLWQRLGHSKGMDSTYRDGTSKQKDRWGSWGEEKTLKGTHANGCLPLSLHSYRDLGLFVVSSSTKNCFFGGENKAFKHLSPLEVCR